MISELYQNHIGKFIIFPNDAIAQHLKQGKPWEPHFETVVNLFISPGDVVVDCGANFGYNSVIMGNQLNNTGALITFEPQRVIHQQLNGNLILNNIYNALTYNVGLGNKEGISNMKYVNYEDNWVNIGDTSIGEGGEEITVYALDSIIDQPVNFMKIDVQGYELYLLQGSKNLISKHKPDLFIEIEPHQLAKFNISEEDLLEYIRSFGYKIFKINNEYPCDHICTINNIQKINKLKQILPIIEV